MNNARRLLLVAGCATALSGCGSKSDANKSNFAAAIRADLRNEGDVCITNADTVWPIVIPDSEIAMARAMASGPSFEMEALQSVGIVESQSAVVTQKAMFGPMVQQISVHRYSLTEKANRFIKTVSVPTLFAPHPPKKPLLCVGEKTLHEVQKWDGPMRFGDYAEATVYYSFEVDGLPDWATNPAVQKAFPVLQQIGNGSPVNTQVILKLSSNGWEVRGAE